MHEAFLNQDIVNAGENILLAVSGGVDSVVMTHLYTTAECELTIAHCNFQLRGDESDKDEAFVQELASKLGIPFLVKRFDTREFAKSHGVSTQMAARELRYQWFHQLIDEHKIDKVALAHHKGDQLETIIFNLTKGTGISGLTGMQAQNGRFVRPLLFADKPTIEFYAKINKLKWREDSSNESLKYSRNLIRHKVIPALKEINPSILDTLDYTLLRLTESESIVNDNILKFVKDNVKKQNGDLLISNRALVASLAPTLTLFEIVSKYGFNYVQCVNIIHTIDHVGKVFYSEKFVLNIDREHLIISTIDDENYVSSVIQVEREDNKAELDTGNLKISIHQAENVEIQSSRNMAFLDIEKLIFPLKIRHWAAGDWFIPLGMTGKKKISDLMIDEKIPLNLKKRVLVLESDGEIVWVIGLRIDDRFKITEDTRSIWKAEYGKV